MPDTNVVKKLAAIVKELGYIEKRGRNEFHKYDYVMEADIVAALREKLASAQIVCVPNVEKIQIDKLDKGIIATIESTYTFTDGSEKVIVRVGGMGYDIPGDKAIYKAMTGAEKYALKQLFLIPTGDDPERDEKDHAGSTGGNPPSERRREAASPRNEAPRNDGGTSRPGSAGDGPAGGKVTFGKNKGKSLSDLSESDLAWWTKAMEESVAKNDPKWHKRNVECLEACNKEWERRQPWREAFNVCVALGEAHGLDKEGVEIALKEELGLSSAAELVPEHVEKFRQFLTGNQG